MKRNFQRKTIGQAVQFNGRTGVIIGVWGGLIGCPSCAELVSNADRLTPCCRRRAVTVDCSGIYDVQFDGEMRPVSVHQDWLN